MRSIVAKMPDIKQDNNLKSASVKCFCETWLNVSQLSPIVQHDKIDIRCDRMTCESKGGVMICVPSQTKPSNTQKFASNGIESVCTTLTLPNGSHMQVALVYRSPSVSLAVLTTFLCRLLNQVSCHVQY